MGVSCIQPMVTLRSSLAKRNAGGPQFRFIPQRIVVELDTENPISEIANRSSDRSGHLLDKIQDDSTVYARVESTLNQLSFETKRLENTGVVVAETEKLTSVVDNIKSLRNNFSDNVVKQVEKLESRAKNGSSKTILDAFRPGMFNFGDSSTQNLEANIRNDLLGSDCNCITTAIEDIQGVLNAQLSYSVNTPGPRNLGVDVSDTKLDVPQSPIRDSSKPDMGDVIEKIGAESAWQIDSGENSVVAIFDTAFSSEFLESDRVIDTFHGEDVDSAFSDPEEGHGTMTAYSAGGNSEDTRGENGNKKVDYAGVAKDSDLLLARLSDSNGSMVYVEEAWDWLAGWIKRLDRPVISNHSYGIPLCSARTQNLCNSIVANMSAALSKRDDHQAIYAAGNEAQYCGHRLSGVTNAISGANSKGPNMAVAAFRYDLNGPQIYSSHGFGTCTTNKGERKPDVGSLIPSVVPYGNKEKNLGDERGGSNAGTSEAAPIVSGCAALIASVTGEARKEVIEGILESTASMPVKSQVNTLIGYDARYGHGQINVDDAVKQAQTLAPEAGPEAVFTYEPANPTPGEEVIFDATASSDPEGDIESYQWNFGDGSEDTGRAVSHTFSDYGTNTVVLTVTDSFNQTSRYTQEVVVSGEPEADFTIEPNTPVVSSPVTFNGGASSDPDGDIEEYEWDFGGGNVKTGETVEYQFSESGDFNVTLRVVDSVGNSDNVTKNITVTAGPTAQFTTDNQNVVIGEDVEFDASQSSDPNDDIEQYIWSFGDGVESSGTVVSHSYDERGNYTVELTVEDSVGNTSSTTGSINVGAVPEARFSVNPRNPTTADTVTLDASASSDPDNNIESYNWNLDNGRSDAGVLVNTQYTNTGTYEVSLTVEDSYGNTDTERKNVNVSAQADPNASFTINPINPVESETVRLDASSSSYPSGEITEYRWSLGNGETRTGREVDVEYSESGNYTISLTVETDTDQSDMIDRQITVSEPPTETNLDARFSITPSNVMEGETITLDGTASSVENADIESYTWNLGDGRSDQGDVVETSYSQSGVYEVSLTVVDSEGYDNSNSQTVVIDESVSPTADFIFNPSDPTTEDTIEFSASPSSDLNNDIESYTWDLGDSRTMTGEVITAQYDSENEYQVLLTVEDSSGNTDTVIQNVSVGGVPGSNNSSNSGDGTSE